MDRPETDARPEDDRVARWAERLNEPPKLDIDALALLWEARIVDGPPA